LGFDEFEVTVVIEASCLLAGDEEINDRLRAVKDTFAKSFDEIAGRSLLKPLLKDAVGAEKAHELMNLLPRPLEPEREEQEREEEEVVFVPSVIANGKLYEMVLEGDEAIFLALDQNGTVEKTSEVRDGKRIYKPLHTPELGRIIAPPTGIEEYGSDSDLFNEIYSFLSRYHYSPYMWEKKLDALYVMLT